MEMILIWFLFLSRVTLKKVTAASTVPTFAHENPKPSNELEMQVIKKKEERMQL